MKSHKKIAYLCAGIFITSLSWNAAIQAADIANSQEQSTLVENTMEKNTITGTAQDWGLSEQEWNQYKQLMQGLDGLWYAHMTPPAVLGMHAETSEVQRHFAEIVARQEHDKVARELDFNNAVFVAMRRLYPDEPMIKDFDKSAFNPINANSKSKSALLQPGDRLALFENIQQGLDLAVLPKLLGLLQSNTKISLDIYCTDSTDDNVIRHWAVINKISANLVSSGRITLNHDDRRLKNRPADLRPPFLLLVRDGQSQVVSVWDL